MYLLTEDVNQHTFGPLDGSLYATITKKQELSPGAVSSPLTVSMDSGISSAGKLIEIVESYKFIYLYFLHNIIYCCHKIFFYKLNYL